MHPIPQATLLALMRSARTASGLLKWVAAASDPERFSSGVPRYRQVLNGWGGEQHTRYRDVIERYLRREVSEALRLTASRRVRRALGRVLP